MVSSKAPDDQNSFAQHPDEFSAHDVPEVVKATCKNTKEVSRKPPKRKITHDQILEE